ncbi:hypothetical protein N9N67_06340 [Bacteriovoracaceae bacterium]|nr:hypothetical protein [Bacteriovoracaceae bacterium]
MLLLKIISIMTIIQLNLFAQEKKLVQIVSNKSPVEFELLIEQLNMSFSQGLLSSEKKDAYLINLNKIELSLKKIATKNTLLIIKSQILKEVINLGKSLNFTSKINSLQIRKAQKNLKKGGYFPFGRYIIHYAIKDFDQLMNTGLIDKMGKKRLTIKERKVIDSEIKKLKFISPLIHHFLSLNPTEFNKFYTSFSLQIIERLSLILNMVGKVSFESQIAENETLVHFVINEGEGTENKSIPISDPAPPQDSKVREENITNELPKINSEKIIDQMIEEKIKVDNSKAQNPEKKQNWTPSEENNSSKSLKNNWVPN